MDVALVQDGRIIQVWRNTDKASLEVSGNLVEFEPGLVVAGMLYEDGKLALPAKAPDGLKKLTRFQFELVLKFLNITQQQVFDQIDLLDMPELDKIVAKTKVETGGNDGLWSRENPLWGILGPKLGVSPEKIDEEWRKVQVL